MLAYTLAVVVIYFSLTPPLYLQEILEHVLLGDSLSHFFIYLVLMCLFTRVHSPPISSIKIGLALIAFGFCIELLQVLSQVRGFDTMDLLSNSIGVFTGFGFMFIWTQIKSKK